MNSPLPLPSETVRLDRRQFLEALSGLVLVASAAGIVKAEDARKYGADAMPHGVSDDPLTFIAIGEDGIVTVVVHRSEMGQGVRTGLPLIVADELEADWSKVRVTQAPADEAKFGNQNTDGSRSVRHFVDPMRRCGAAARAMLEAAAAATWKVPVQSVRAVNHEVIHTESGRKLGYGALARAAAKLPVPPRESLRLKQPSQFRYIGKDGMPMLDGPDIAHGRAQYGIDVRVEGMLFAVVARSPVFGGKVARFDAAEALKIPGVVKVVEIPGTPIPSQFQPLNGVAVIAQDTWTAIKARQALKIEWNDGEHGSYDSTAYRAELEQAARKPGKVAREVGDVDAAMAKAARKVEAEYYLPHIAHATMEPPNATARIVDGRCEVWAPTQAPQGTREDVAKRLGLPLEKVTVHVTLLGGGFGRKSKHDFAIEAACPVTADGWPASESCLDARRRSASRFLPHRFGRGTACGARCAGQAHRMAASQCGAHHRVDLRAGSETRGDFELGMGVVNVPFQIPNMRMENPPAAAHTRIGWFRSVSNVPHAFAVQSFVAELAAAAGRDHRDYLLDLIGPARRIDPGALQDTWNHDESPQRYPFDTGRLRRVIEIVTREAGWGRKLPKGRAWDWPRTTASSATWLQWSKCRSARRESSSFRASTSRSIAARRSIPTASARSSKAPPSWA